MKAYLDLLSRVRYDGRPRESRAVLKSTGLRPRTVSLFGPQAEFDLARGFPLVTTKRVPFRLVVAELLWFLSGSTNVRPLQEQDCHIWDDWCDEDGDLGPVYGHQWRRFNGTFDQVARLMRDIDSVLRDPQASASRRLILTSWNPCDVDRVKGPSGCHTLCQFYVQGRELSCKMYQRSADLFLGVPFNIACYGLLTRLIAHVTGLVAHRLILSFGDAHIYENHVAQVTEQLARSPRRPPTLVLDPAIASLDGIQPELISLVGYNPHPALRGEVAV